MPFAPTSPVAGAVETSFSSPTYTLTSDTPPDINAKQYAITAVGGTQVGVTSHSVGSPFTHTMFRPKVLKVLGNPNPVTGIITGVERNVYSNLTRKGVTVLAGQPINLSTMKSVIDLPAGSDTADAPNVKALQSCHIGILWESSNDIGDVSLSGVL